jgi:hypothetical protein
MGLAAADRRFNAVEKIFSDTGKVVYPTPQRYPIRI